MRSIVLGATGYAGQVLLTLLMEHPEITEIVPVSRSQAGEPVDRALPKFPAHIPLIREGRLFGLEEAARSHEAEPVDIVFSCLPHLKSAEAVAPYVGSAVVVDLSADFRIPDAELFTRGYGEAPPRGDLLDRAVYGLSEVFTEELRSADLIANPGCYPTSVLLPVLPLLRRGVIGGPIHAAAMSGVTGAGKKVQESFLYGEVDESIRAYAPGSKHRHWFEMKHYLAEAAGDTTGDMEAGFLFVPHLVPMRRGIAATITVSRKDCSSDADLATAYREAYGDRPFIRATSERIPATGHVAGSNRCDISWRIEEESVLLFAGIDNLLKGAAGQAVQNMNIRFGLDEAAGLPRSATM
jgi:N-acetyl-gamma-glutamyl-phosphate reductase